MALNAFPQLFLRIFKFWYTFQMRVQYNYALKFDCCIEMFSANFSQETGTERTACHWRIVGDTLLLVDAFPMDFLIFRTNSDSMETLENSRWTSNTFLIFITNTSTHPWKKVDTWYHESQSRHHSLLLTLQHHGGCCSSSVNLQKKGRRNLRRIKVTSPGRHLPARVSPPPLFTYDSFERVRDYRSLAPPPPNPR